VITEAFENFEHNDGYTNSITGTSPDLPKTSLVHFISSWDPTMAKTSFPFEPCVFKSDSNDLFNSTYNINIMLEQGVTFFPSNMQVNMTATIVFEDTLIPYDLITGKFPTSTWGNYYGEYRYKTIKLSESEIASKNLVIQFSTNTIYPVTMFLKEVFFATGGQCIWDKDGLFTENQNRFVRSVFFNTENPMSWKVTIPARDLWYIAFKPLWPEMKGNLAMDVFLEDSVNLPAGPDQIEPTPETFYSSSSSYIQCLDFNLMVVFILSLLIFQK